MSASFIPQAAQEFLTSPATATRPEIILIDPEARMTAEDLTQLDSQYYVTSVQECTRLGPTIAAFGPSVILLMSPLARYGSASSVLLTARIAQPSAQVVLLLDEGDRVHAPAWLGAGASALVALPASIAEIMASIDCAVRRADAERDRHTLSSRLMLVESVRNRLQMVTQSADYFDGKTNIRDFGPALLQHFATILDARGGSIFLCHDDCLECLHSMDPDHVPASIPLPLREGSVFRQAMQRKEPMIVCDIHEEVGLQPSGWNGYENGSLFVFPLVDAAGRVGALIALHSKKIPIITESDRELGQLIGRLSSEAFRGYLTTQALRENEFRLDTLLSNLPGMVYRCRNDEYWTMEYVSDGCFALTGLAPKELIRNKLVPYQSIILPEDRQRVHEEIAQALTEGDSFRVHYRIRHADGSLRWLWEQGRLVAGPADSEHSCLEGLIMDITEQREAQAQLLRLAMAVEQANELFVITETDGTITYVNPAFERMTGYASAEVVGKTPAVLHRDTQLDALYSDLCKTVGEGRPWQGKLLNQTKAGSSYTVETTISPLRDETGRVVNYIAVARDVTKEAELEAQLRQAQKMEAIGQLAAGVAHEISTPTQYVGDNVRFVQESCRGLHRLFRCYQRLADQVASTAMHETFLRDVQVCRDEIDVEFLETEVPLSIRQSLDGLQRVADIVRALKVFAHPGGDQMTMANLNEAINSTATVARNEYKYVAELKLDLDQTLPSVACYVGEINQVILNLVVNAAHAIAEKNSGFSTEKGTITVSTREVEQFAEIRVSDTGAGIPEAIRHRIFEPFFTTKGVGKGTGQGLALTHRVIVERHGGTVGLESEVGAGSTFILRIPIQPASSDSEFASET